MKHLKGAIIAVGAVISYTIGAVFGYCISNDDDKGIAMLGCAIIGLTLFAGIETVVERLRKQNKDICLDEDVYIDEAGCHHDSGIGWNPQGVWCGECTRANGRDCPNFNKTKEEEKWQI